jgi:hypothetical protein
MPNQDHPQQKNDRWAWRTASLIMAGGLALLGGLALSIFEHAPNWVPLTGATLLICCYAAAAVLAVRHA